MSDYWGFFLVGATASGKSGLAQCLAETHGFAVLSADSMLVYRGMNIGTAKPTAEERGTVDYGGIDLVEPDCVFSVWQYREQAITFLDECAARGQDVVVAGGSGLYVKSLTHGISDSPALSAKVRARWEKVFRESGVDVLKDALRNMRPDLYEALADKENPRRLVRALSLADAGGSNNERSWGERRGSAPLVGIRLPPEQLSARIEKRVEIMFESGLVEEVKELRSAYPNASSSASQAIGYREVASMLGNDCTKDEAVTRIAQRTRQLAKKQRTWFRHQADVTWVDIDENDEVSEIAEQVMARWKEHGPTEIAG